MALGVKVRKFTKSTCHVFSTHELPREASAWIRREAKLKASGKGKLGGTGGPHPRVFNLNTYKMHALGDYPSSIQHFGTLESYSTEAVHPGLLL